MTATTVFASGFRTLGTLLIVTFIASGCGLDKQTAPSLTGPSGPALSLRLSASPDILRRDGVSRSTITLTALDAQGGPVNGRRFLVRVSSLPETGGTLSVEEVVTGSDGRATFQFIAPEADIDVTDATVLATPFSEDFGSTPGSSVRLGILGPAFPSPSFTFTPSSPALLETVTFSASSTTVDGVACLAACTYRWEFNDEATLDGEVVDYAFQNEGFYNVKLTVQSLKHNTTKTVTQRLKVGLTP
jgi:hypothetical protein